MTLPSDLVSRTRRRLVDEFGKVFRRGDRVALLDFPDHANVGDSAIWLGERALLKSLGTRVVYAADQSGYDPSHLAAAIGGAGIIALSGGGNFGDLWTANQTFRERVIREFPHHRIVQFPQSIWFDDPNNMARVRDALKAHAHIVLFVRDNPSAALARASLGVEPILVPDCAFGLGPLKRTREPVTDVLYLHRNDQESPSSSSTPSARPEPDLQTQDWDEPYRSEKLLNDHVWRAVRMARLGCPGALFTTAYLDKLGALRMRRGLDILSSGKAVVTDRLHGVLLSIIAGIPVVALDNRVGKISAYLETWFESGDTVRIASTLSQALELTRQSR